MGFEIPMSLEYKAMYFAIKQHGITLRKYDKMLYISHCLEVASIVKTVSDDENMIAASWLHDTVEDTDCSTDNIFEIFGEKVAMYVEMLTDISEPSDGNRKIRKQIDLEHTKRACPTAKTIKLADIISNTISICQYDSGFARTYIPEMRKLLYVLTEGDDRLWIIASNVISRCEESLKGYL